MAEEKCMVEINTFLEDLNILIEGYGNIVTARHNLTVGDETAKRVLEATIKANEELKQNLKESIDNLVKCIITQKG